MGVQVIVDIASTDGSLQLQANATQVLFPGFLRAFENFDTGATGWWQQVCSTQLHAMRNTPDAATAQETQQSVVPVFVITQDSCVALSTMGRLALIRLALRQVNAVV